MPHGTRASSVTLDDNGDLLVTGSDGVDGIDGLVSLISGCDGAILASTLIPHPGVEAMFVLDAAATPSSWVVVGHRYEGGTVTEAFVAELDVDDLTTISIETLPSPMDQAQGVGIADDNSRWVTGISDVDGVAGPWTAMRNESAETCGFPAFPGPESTGYTSELAISGGYVYVAGGRGSQAIMARFDPLACAIGGCPCTPELSIEFEVLPEDNEVRAMVAVGDVVYVGGYASSAAAPDDEEAFIVRIDPLANAVEQVWTWNPSPRLDAVLDLTYRNGALYAATTTNYDGKTEEEALAGIVVLPADIESGTLWEAQVAGMNLAYGVVVTDAAVFVGGRGVQDGRVVRCTSDGDCPL